ncbi:MAG: hypothetical protein WBC49_04085, partial [Thermoplasmata archaeon]
MIRRSDGRENIASGSYGGPLWSDPVAVLNDIDRVFDDFGSPAPTGPGGEEGDTLDTHEGRPLTDDVDIDELASRMHNFTGAEIAAVANEAIMLAIRDLVLSGEELDEATISAVRVDMKYFEKAMENV